MNASKKLGPDQARDLLADAVELQVAKGAKLTVFDLTADYDEDAAIAAMLGPTGNLRAPTLRVGKRVFVGFPKSGYPL